MRLHGIKARGKRKFVVTTDSRHDLPVAADLLERDFIPSAPDRVWSSDITYIATDDGWLYLAAVIDLFSRQVVGWSMQPHMQTSLVTDALRMAWRQKGCRRWALDCYVPFAASESGAVRVLESGASARRRQRLPFPQGLRQR